MLSLDDLQRRHNMWETVLNSVHGFFASRGFTHVRTPLLVKTPGMEPNLDPFEVNIEVPGEGSREAGLITSPEFAMKKLLGAGFEKIYTIGSVFRNGESLGPHNLPEFTMLEWYAPGSYEDLMNETEDLLKHVLEDAAAWPRFDHKDANVDEHGDPHVEARRFFVKNYPASQAALAKLTPDGKYAQRFEAFADGLELCNGFAELTDPGEQRARFEKEQAERHAAGKTVFPVDEELLKALGEIPHDVYGNALGIDRLVMLRYGVGDINDIQLFPANERY